MLLFGYYSLNSRIILRIRTEFTMRRNSVTTALSCSHVNVVKLNECKEVEVSTINYVLF